MHPVQPIKENDHQPPVQVLLNMGKWRNLFPRQLYYNMLARALNTIVEPGNKPDEKKGRTNIHGYLFNGQHVYLVLHIRHTTLVQVLRFFSEQLREEIRKQLTLSVRQTGNPAAKKALYVLGEVRLFVKHPFNSYWLADLLTGKQVYLPYYDPHLEQLKQRVKESAYCSAIDYSGGIGPVLVKKIQL